MKIKYAFVILNYNTAEETIACIESIRTIENGNSAIIVVDNGSKNNDSDVLISKYYDLKNVKIVSTEKNLGFAQGNNYGVKTAMELYDPEFYIVINSDTVISQFDFLKQIDNVYSIKHFDVLGPDIVTISNAHQNPYRKTISLKKVRREILKIHILRIALFFGLNGLLEKIIEIYNSGKKTTTAFKDAGTLQYNVPLHGSAVIFNSSFIKKYGYAFYPETFIYGEEEILSYIIKRDNLVSVYAPNVRITHKEDASLNKSYKSGRKRKAFVYNNALNSKKILFKMMKTD